MFVNDIKTAQFILIHLFYSVIFRPQLYLRTNAVHHSRALLIEQAKHSARVALL